MERTWLEVGKEYTSGKDRDRVTAAIEALEWHPSTDVGPMCPMLMLQEVISELRLPKVSALAWGGGEDNVLDYPDGPETATYTLLGVEANYADGQMRLYVLDTGGARYRWRRTSRCSRRQFGTGGTEVEAGWLWSTSRRV